MSATPAIHTTKHGQRWVNTREGASAAIGSFDSQFEAATAGRRLARRERAEHITHRADGSIFEITLAG